MVRHSEIPHSDEEEWRSYNINPEPFYATNPERKLIGEEEDEEKRRRLEKFNQDLYTELTPRQLSILKLRNKKRGFAEIAGQLGFTRKTIWQDFQIIIATVKSLAERYGLSPSEIEFWD
jgi:hypothetical protein